MAFQASTAQILSRIEAAVEAKLDDRWVAEPPAARAALLVREALADWTRSTYPGSACEGGSLDPDSRRRLSLVIHSAPVSHRVEIRGLACGDAREAELAPDGHAAHSWVVLAHVGPPCPRLEESARRLAQAGLKRLEERCTSRLALSVWMGAAAPDGCPACLGKT
jgi:hypothetical protein